MARHSQQDQDGVVWQTAAIPLGAAGLDLRTPTSPGSLTKLLNARFRDESTIERRNGFRGVEVQDADHFAAGTNTPTGWIYGHGQALEALDDAHFPIAGHARGTFHYDDNDIVWTGDRLLIVREDDRFIGASEFWSRGAGVVEPRGIPAYLPVQTDAPPPDVVTGDYVETCITPDLRVVLASSDNEDLIAWVIHRETGAVINRTDIVVGGNGIYEPRVISSDDIPVAMWLDGTDLMFSRWTGGRWTHPSALSSSVVTFEVAPAAGGFIVAWQSGGVVRVGQFRGRHAVDGDFTFGTPLALPGNAAGAMALAVADNGTIGLAWQTDALMLYASTFGKNGTVGAHRQLSLEAGPWNGGIAACFRYFDFGQYGRPNLVVHATNGSLYTQLWELYHSVINIFPEGGGPPSQSFTLHELQTDKRFNTRLASKSWRIGDEVFCWFQARNSETNYLVAGVTNPQVCGICDREEAPSRVVRDTGAPGYGIKGIPMVYVDPDDEYRATWIRPYTTSRVITIDEEREKIEDLYNRAGNCRVGDMNFLPRLSTAAYGESVYFAGSLVRNWDGMELGDAGFHDYPICGLAELPNGSGDVSNGTYNIRVYPVRYNKRGERFQGPAITEGITVTGTNDAIRVTIQTVPATNHHDVQFEVWRTEAGGTTFYLDGTVENSMETAQVTYNCTIADVTLRARAADPHAPGIGFLAELEEMGPLGCEILVAAGDRLWGAGGQVPPGYIQFSKLKEPGEGAGFDALAGTTQINITGAAINSIAAFGDAIVFLQRDGLQALGVGLGPDNYGVGGFGIPQLVLADGAVTHFGTASTPVGMVYWGADGPRLLSHNFTVDQICAPVRELTRTLTPSGVRVDLARQEVVWFTEEGVALLWNYRSVESRFGSLTSLGRWAQWSGLNIAGSSQFALVTTDGRVLYEDADAVGDAGVPFEFAGATGYIAPQAILGGHTHIRALGVVGEYLGKHELQVKVYYDGSPMWSMRDTWRWQPALDVGHLTGNDLADLDAADLDALEVLNRSGAYATHKKLSRHSCRHFRVEWSDRGSLRPTYRLHELTLEIGAVGGLGRVAVSNFS